MTTKEKIAVMQAYLDGKQIQVRTIFDENAQDWRDFGTKEPLWRWEHCYYRVKPEEEPEEEKTERMTNRQLAEWCGKGKGHLKRKGRGLIFFDCEYEENSENDLVSEEILIRHWWSDEWVEPTVDIYNRDCKD